MLLNRLEFVLRDNPGHAALQRHVEVPRFLRMGGSVQGAKALGIGCGRGVGLELIPDVFGVSSVDAFDLDPRIIPLARRRLCERESRVRLWVGDAAAIVASGLVPEQEQRLWEMIFWFVATKLGSGQPARERPAVVTL